MDFTRGDGTKAAGMQPSKINANDSWKMILHGIDFMITQILI